MRKYLIIPFLLAGLIVLGAACSKEDLNINSENKNGSVENVNSVLNTNSIDNDSNSDDDINTNGDDGNSAANNTLRVTNPEKDKQLESPFEVEGRSVATTVYVRIKNSVGTTLFTESATPRGGEFHLNLTFSFTHTSTGTVEIFEKNSSGAEVNLISVPVTFKVESSDTSLSNTNSDDSGDDADTEDTNTNS